MARRRTTRPDPKSIHEDELDRLYGLPLGEFTSARNALAARLQNEGQSEAAAQIRALPKPTLPVWAVNRIARQDRVGVEWFVQAVERVKAVQVAGGDALAPAAEAQQTIVRHLRERAEAVLKAAGMKATPETLDRVSKALVAAAVNAPSDLRRGRLVKELELPGFEALAGAVVPVAPSAHDRTRPDARATKIRRGRVERAREALGRAESEARELEERASKLEQRAVEGHRAADEAAGAAERGRHEAERAAARIKETEQALKAAEQDLARYEG